MVRKNTNEFTNYFEHEVLGTESIGVEVNIQDYEPFVSSSTKVGLFSRHETNENDDRGEASVDICEGKHESVERRGDEETDLSSVGSLNAENQEMEEKDFCAVEVTNSGQVIQSKNNENNLKMVNSLDVAERRLQKNQLKIIPEMAVSATKFSKEDRVESMPISNAPIKKYIGENEAKSSSSKKSATFNDTNSNVMSSSLSKLKEKKGRRVSLRKNEKASKSKSSCRKTQPLSYEEIESQLQDGILERTSSTHKKTPHFDMRSWLAAQYLAEESITKVEDDEIDNTKGSSYSLIVHEIRRGNWTWSTAWSPDGKRLALASENHHLAIVDTSSSTVWKVIHDARISSEGPSGKNNAFHSIRAIAWGSKYIAVGGTGNSVSILDPNTYLILYTIPNTGFVGSLDWRANSTTLAIGNREESCLIVSISFKESGVYVSQLLHSIRRKDWVNVVAFSPGGTMVVIGDRAGKVSTFVYLEQNGGVPSLQLVKDFKFSGAILSAQWSSCGGFLYVGGENFKVSFIRTNTWTVLHEMKRDRWVQFLAPSNTGLNLAIGGSDNLAIIDSKNEFMTCKTISFGGPVLLDAKWHPSDQYLAIGGQDGSVLVVETTNVRYVENGYLRLDVGIQCLAFSPMGTVLVVGRFDGVVTFMDTIQPSFVVSYEVVLGADGAKDIKWNPDGNIVAVGGGDIVVVVSATPKSHRKSSPYLASNFSLVKVIRGLKGVESISFSPEYNLMVVSGLVTKVFDAEAKYACIFEMKIRGCILASSWSQDGNLLAMTGKDKILNIYNTSSQIVSQWKPVFRIKCDGIGTSLAWGPCISASGLQYLSYGGENKTVTIIEIRTKEESWEMVLEIPRKAQIHDLDWSRYGMLAIATSNGTATVVDLSYLLTGTSVIEMDYNWQRQGITCLTEIQRKQNKNRMRSLQWLGPKATEGNVLALGGSDGIFEIIDMTERKRIDEYFDTLYHINNHSNTYSRKRSESIHRRITSFSK